MRLFFAYAALEKTFRKATMQGFLRLAYIKNSSPEKRTYSFIVPKINCSQGQFSIVGRCSGNNDLNELKVAGIEGGLGLEGFF